MNQEQSSEGHTLDVDDRRVTEDDNLMSQQETDEDHGIKFKDWGFKIDRLFEVALRFYKRNESKAFHPSFDIRNQMNALILQARYGNYDDGKAPDIGTLDLVGKSRRHQWSMLKGMSRAEAMSKFICTLDEICPLFKAYAEAIKISSGIQLDTSNDENGRVRSDSERQQQSDSDEQLKAIHTSLCRQTYDQFKNYAEKQYPDDIPKQKYLISSLQEQYYQQYISNMKPDLNQNQKKRSSLSSPTISESSTTDSNQQQLNNNVSSEINQVQSNTLVQHIDTAEGSTGLVDSSKPYPSEEKLTTMQTESDSDLATIDLHNSCSATPQQTIPAQPNLTGDLGSSMTYNSVTIECSTVQEPVKPDSNGEVLGVQDKDYVDKPIIGEFESYPEPKPIQKSTISQQRSSAINLFNYRGDTGTKQPQNQQQPTTSLYGNSITQSCDAPQPLTMPSSIPITSQQPILPPQYEQLPSDQRVSPIQESNINESNERPVIDTWGCDDSSGTSSPLQQTVTTYEPLEPATIWTKKGVIEFRDSLMGDKHGGSYIVKQGTLLTIQVPTYPDGRYIYWEFTTEDYDIGFGLDFIYESNLEKPLALKFFEEADEDDDEMEELYQNNINYDIESAVEMEKQNGSYQGSVSIRSHAEKFARTVNTISIVPTYRRDSHEEVFVGRHRYPGQGYYLLKFDNTYSVLRSKPLYFRICYFI